MYVWSRIAMVILTQIQLHLTIKQIRFLMFHTGRKFSFQSGHQRVNQQCLTFFSNTCSTIPTSKISKRSPNWNNNLSGTLNIICVLFTIYWQTEAQKIVFRCHFLEVFIFYYVVRPIQKKNGTRLKLKICSQCVLLLQPLDCMARRTVRVALCALLVREHKNEFVLLSSAIRFKLKSPNP